MGKRTGSVLFGDRGKAVGALALACLTVLATVVAVLEADASMNAQRGKRDTDRIALEASGTSNAGLLRIGTAYGVWRRWFEQIERSNSARDAAQTDPDQDDRPVLDALATIDLEISEWIRGHSELLQPPYHDEDGAGTDFRRFEADADLEPRLRARERHDVESAVAADWDQRSTTYVTILTVVAVALFFVGLGANLGGAARRSLVAGGVLLGALAAVWSGWVAATPVHRVPDEAVARVVDARLETWLAYDVGSDVSAERRERYERAVRLADEAAGIDPAYASAFGARADARLAHGESLWASEGRSDASDALLLAAIEDFKRAIVADPTDFVPWSNLGWAAFLAGDTGLALQGTERALELTRNVPSLHVQRAIVMTALGDETRAGASVDAALAGAAVDSGAYQLASSISFLRALAEQDPVNRERFEALERRLREAQVALAVSGTPAPRADAPGVADVDIVALRFAPGARIAEGMAVVDGQTTIDPDGVGYRVRIAADGSMDGTTVSARIERDGFPEAGYDVDVAWPAGEDVAVIDLVDPYGRATFWLPEGSYRLRLYVDGATRGDVAWQVPAERGPQLAMSVDELLDSLAETGMACRDEAPDGDAKRTVCEAEGSDGAHVFRADASRTPDGTIVRLVFEAEAVDGSSIAEDARRFFEPVVRRLYGDERGGEVIAWLAERGTAFGQVRVLGSYVRSFGEGEQQRSLEILP